MLNELITWVLNTYLGKYLENFNPAQLSVALLSGEVELENVPIRKDAFSALGIPIQAFSGNIGKIKLQVPVRKFRTAPWCITIEHVYAVFGPKDLNEWNDEKERKADFEYKLAELDAHEAQWRANKGISADSYYSASYSNWLNCGTSLATNILENLELKIHDVHLRYEDTINVAACPIATGIKIAALTMQTCDALWSPSAQWGTGDEGISYKLIELRDFSVYWDRMSTTQACSQLTHDELLLNLNERCEPENHRYLIKPITARAQCKRERCRQAIRSKQRPRLYCEILIPAVKFSLSDLQYQQIIECIAGIRYITTIRAYRVRRPKIRISVGGANVVSDWWRYAAQCHGHNFRTAKQQCNVVSDNLRYMRLYRRLLVNPNEQLSKQDSDFKHEMEQQRELSELKLLRHICCQDVYVENQTKARNLSQSRGGRSMLFHWFPNWMGWYGNNNNINTQNGHANNVNELDIEVASTHSSISSNASLALAADLSKTNDIAETQVNTINSTAASTTSIVAGTNSSSTSLVTALTHDASQTLDADYQNIENDILNALETSFENDSFAKRDAVFGYLTFILVDGQFVISMETADAPITKLEMDFTQLTSVIEIKPRFNNYTMSISLGSVCLRDMLTKGTKFPYLIRPQAENSANANAHQAKHQQQQQQQPQFTSIKKLLLQKSAAAFGKITTTSNKEIDSNESDSSSNGTAASYENNSEPWFQLQYEKGPLDIQSDMRLVVKSRSLDVVYNKQAFEWLAQFLTKPMAQYDNSRTAFKTQHKDVDAAEQQQEQTTEQEQRGRLRFLQSWKHLLIGSKMQHRKTWSYEIDISAPQIIFVENFMEKHTTIVIMDFGHFQLMKNKMRRKDSIAATLAENISTKSSTSIVTNNSNNLRKTDQLENAANDDDDDDQFMTPCSTPPGSEISFSSSPPIPSMLDADLNEMNMQQMDEQSMRLENAFHNRLYDKYYINLTDMQILICRVSVHERGGFMQIRAQPTGNNHLLERFNIALRLERRVIYTVDPEYPSLTVCATLPKLVAHIDEQNINMFLKIVYPLLTTPEFFAAADTKVDKSTATDLEKTIFYSTHNATITSTASTPKTNFSSGYIDSGCNSDSESEPSLSNTNLIVGHFRIGQMILEMKSSKKSISEMQIHGINLSITKRLMDTHLNLSVHGLLLVDAIQSFGPDFELLVASHRHVGMDSLSGSLRRSKPCSPTTCESPDSMSTHRPMSPGAISQAVHSLKGGQSEFNFKNDAEPALITVEINRVQDEDPITIATINFYNLDVIANQETIVELLSFFNQIMYAVEQFCNKSSSNKITTATTQTADAQLLTAKDATVTAAHMTLIEPKKERIEISFEFHRLNVLVMRTIKHDNCVLGQKVGTLTMSEAKIDATLGAENEMCIIGSLGGIQVIDITPEGTNHQRIFSVGKDPLTDPPVLSGTLRRQQELLQTLTQEVYGKTQDAETSSLCDNNSNALMFQVQRECTIDALQLKVRMASVWYTHCPRFMHEISECISQFKHFLKAFVRSMRNKATDIAMEFVHSSNEFNLEHSKRTLSSNKPKLSIDIILNSPVFVLPRNSLSSEVFVAHLGKISVYNTHEEQFNKRNNKKSGEYMATDSNEMIARQTRDQYHIKVRNIKLYSLDTTNRKDIRLAVLPRAHEIYSCATDAQEILHDTALFFTFTKDTTKTMELGKCRYETLLTVAGSVTKLLQVSLTRAQYKQLNESLHNATKFHEKQQQQQHHHQNKTEHVDGIKVTEFKNAEQATSTTENIKQQQHKTKINEEAPQQSATKSLVKQRIHLGTRLQFIVPCLKMHLKNDNEHELIKISLSEFSVLYNRCDSKKDMEILLRSIIVEDLKVSKRSKCRNMVDSTADEITLRDARRMYRDSTSYEQLNDLITSNSCPNLVTSTSLLKRKKCTSLPAYMDGYVNKRLLTQLSHTWIDDVLRNPKYAGKRQKQLPKILKRLSTGTFNMVTTNERDKNLVIYKSYTRDVDDGSGESFTSSSIDFNCLNLILSVERWFNVLDFFGFIDTQEKQVRGPSKVAVANSYPKYNSKLKVTVRSLNLILVRADFELAKANISNVYLKICQSDIVESVEGRLGSISLYDLTRYGRLYREKFSTSGQEALNFHYKRLRSESNKTERCLAKDSILKIQMSSVRYIHTKRFLYDVHIYVNELLQLQTPVIKHMQVSEKEKSTMTRPLQIGLEIYADAPIILLPMSYKSAQLIIADLGKLTLTNEFHWANDDVVINSRRKLIQNNNSATSMLNNSGDEAEQNFIEILDVMHVDLVNINLFAGEWQTLNTPYRAPSLRDVCLRIGDFVVLKKGNSLFEETCHLKLQIERNTDAQFSHQCADLSVQGTLSKLNGVLHLQQYRLIRGFLSYNLGEDIDDIYNNFNFDFNQSIERLHQLHDMQQQQQQDCETSENVAVWKTMSISLLLENVSLLIALEQQITINIEESNDSDEGKTQQETKTATKSKTKPKTKTVTELEPLACIKFIKSALEIDSYSDGAQDIDLISTEILLLDSRNEQYTKNVFKHILQPMRNKNADGDNNNTNSSSSSSNSSNGSSSNSNQGSMVQAEIHSRRRGGHSKYTILLNNMRIMAILDCIERLKNFLQAEPHMPFKMKTTTTTAEATTETPTNAQKFDKWQTQNVSTPTTIKKTFMLNNTIGSISELECSQLTDNDANNGVLEIVLNITNSELLFVEKLYELDSNAIILKSTTVFTYKMDKHTITPVSVDINHMEVFSCILGEEDTSALSIIDPFTLNIELKHNCLHMLIPQQLCIRLSYNDVKLFHRMLESVPKQTHKPQSATLSTNATNQEETLKQNEQYITALLAMGFTATDSWEAMSHSNYDVNAAAKYLMQQRRLREQRQTENSHLTVNEIQLSADGIYCCIIDDCMDADVPLLECSFSQLKYTQQLKRTAVNSMLSAQLQTQFACDYYNRHLSGWEPIIETWPCIASWQWSHNLAVQIQSKQLLRFNVTTTLIELCDMVRRNWTQDYYNVDVRQRRTPFVPFALQNDTGDPLYFQTICIQAGGTPRKEITQQEMQNNWLSAAAGAVTTFDFGQQTKLRHMDSHKLNVHQLLLQIQGWALIGPISIDKVGVYFRYATGDLQYKKRTRIVFDIALVGSAQKLITVKSALNVINKLDRALWLKMENRLQEREEWLKLIKPQERVTVPLRYVDDLLFIKPHGIGILEHSIAEAAEEAQAMERMGYCTRGIAWQECNSKEALQELYTCYSQYRSLFHVLIEVRPDKYPVRDIVHLPGHTISVLAPLKLRNLLCCELSYRFDSQLKGRILAGSTAYIYDVNMQQCIYLSLTLDNYQVSGQLKIPLGHSGVVEPKLKLIDLNNRELLLRVSIQYLTGNGMEIFVSAPVWLINKTGLPLMYRQEGTGHSASGQFEEHETARDVTPLLFSFSDQEGSPAIEMRLGQRYGDNNPWCKSFNIHKEIAFRELRAEQSKGCYAVGINVRRGRGVYSCTTFVALSPRFQLYNRTKYRLELAQKCDIKQNQATAAENLINAAPGCNFPFHWPNCEQEPLLCVRIFDVPQCYWSHGIPINEAQSLYLNVRDMEGEMWFLRLDVISRQATFLLLFTDAQLLPPPIRVDNYSEVQISFHQASCRPYWKAHVRPQSSLAYALDDPLGMQSLQIEAPGGNTIEYSLSKLEISRPLTYANFIYIAFKATFSKTAGFESQELVLGVFDRRVILTRKVAGNRSQLWLMNSNGQLEHEGSSPPTELTKPFIRNADHGPRMVLDLEKAPNSMECTRLVIRPPNNQRLTTQTWRFVNGRLMCHANMCVQPVNGIYGLREGVDAVLARIQAASISSEVPCEQAIEIQKFRPGSGHLEVSGKMDGPIRNIIIRDIKAAAAAGKDDIQLQPDPRWQHASIQLQTTQMEEQTVAAAEKQAAAWYKECNLNITLQTGVGVSVVTRHPYEELAYMTFEGIAVHALLTARVKSLELRVQELQIDNQLLDTSCPVLLHTIRRPQDNDNNSKALTYYNYNNNIINNNINKDNNDDKGKAALSVCVKMLNSPNRNAVIFEYVLVEICPCAVYLEERLILKTAMFLGYGQMLQNDANSMDAAAIAEPSANDVDVDELTRNAVRYYFENLSLAPTQIRLSVLTAPKLATELMNVKKALSLTLIKFEDAIIEFDAFTLRHQFETTDIYMKVLRTHYINQLKWHAAAILGSVDFLGNPLGFANDLSEGVSGLIFEGSVKSLVKNVTHGISNSTAKLTETISDSLGRVVLDEHDNETRQKILELPSNTSGGHLTAGLKGFGFGLLGGVTSIVRYTYVGTVNDGFPGFLSGLGKGLVGTVTKPIIGILDLASETANAVRETSKSSSRSVPARKRLPRCVSGAPGGLLPTFSYRQAKGQQYLYLINRRNFAERLMAYEPCLCNDHEAKLRLLVSTEYVRIFSRCDEDPTIMFECHLSEVLSCHALITNVTIIAPNNTNEIDKDTQQKREEPIKILLPSFYIEISTNLPKITRPRVRCQNEEIAEHAARCINYAKTVFDDRELSVMLD